MFKKLVSRSGFIIVSICANALKHCLCLFTVKTMQLTSSGVYMLYGCIKLLYLLNVSDDTNISLQWRHNERGNVPNDQPRDCLLSRLFRRRSKKTSKLRVTGLCAGNSPETGEFPVQMASNAENVSMTSSCYFISLFVVNIAQMIGMSRTVFVSTWCHLNVLLCSKQNKNPDAWFLTNIV